METVCLKLRKDLIISEQGGKEGTMFVIKDPVLGRFFRFREIEHFIAKQLDGNTSLDITQKRVEEKFGVLLSKENLDQFASRLKRIGLLSDSNDSGAIHIQQIEKTKVSGDIFYLRFKLLDPDQFLDRLLPYLRFLFTPAFIILSALFVSFAVGITTSHWPEITNQFYAMFRFESLFLAWIIVISVVTLHEFAHGLTCKYFGGHVREMGFMLIFFQPAFYCNVSDAWLFPEKSKRMWVTFAGAYFEIFVWALATFTWRITDPSTSLNHFALIVTVTSAFKMFFNMNPLIKLDGYYLLSDWLNIPNLRQKASLYLRSRIKRLWLKPDHSSLVDVTAREGPILILYAILSTLYIYWILSSIAIWFGGYMVNNYQGWGLIMYATVMGVFFRQPIKRLVSAKTNVTTTDDPKPKSRRPWLTRIVIFTLVALLGALLYFGHADLKVNGEFTVLPEHNADVRAEVEGIIEEVFVDEGSHVERGDSIARLSDMDYMAEQRKVEAEIEAKQAELKLLKAGTRPEEIELARTQVAKAAERYNFGKSYFERDKISVEQKLISPKEFEETKEQFTIRLKELEEARKKLETLQAGPRAEEIQVVEAAIRRLHSQRQYLAEQVHSLLVTSPINGVVTTHKLKEKVGENIKKGDLIAEVFELKTVIVEIAVPEKEIGEVRIDQRVELKVRAYPGKTFEGRINSISPVAVKPDEWLQNRSVLVTTQLDNSSGLLKPQMTGNAKIYCGDRRLFELITHRIVRYIRVEFWSWF